MASYSPGRRLPVERRALRGFSVIISKANVGTIDSHKRIAVLHFIGKSSNVGVINLSSSLPSFVRNPPYYFAQHGSSRWSILARFHYTIPATAPVISRCRNTTSEAEGYRGERVKGLMPGDMRVLAAARG